MQIIPYGDAQKLLLSRDVTRLDKLETMRRDFVANVSHELRTPLTVLSGFLETIKELQLDPQRSRDYVNLMAEQSKRMDEQVHHFRLRAGAVHGLLDRDHLWIVGGFLEKIHDRRK